MAEVAAEYHVLRKLDERWSDDEMLHQAMFFVNVPERQYDTVERRVRMQLGISVHAVHESLTERWRHVGTLLMTQTDVRKAYHDAAAAELDAETTLELMEAAAG